MHHPRGVKEEQAEGAGRRVHAIAHDDTIARKIVYTHVDLDHGRS